MPWCVPYRLGHRRLVACLVGAAAALSATVPLAHANGAFPDSQAILLPSTRSDQIFLSTNFGLLRSDDGGAHFGWICEDAIGPSAYSYQIGPAPDHRVFAITSTGLVVSDDAGCTFTTADGLLNASDVFPDPNDPKHVLAIAQAMPSGSGVALRAIFSSSDGGLHFTRDYTAEPSVFIASVESAHSNPAVIYLATSLYEGRNWRPSLARSADAGQTYAYVDVLDLLGPVVPYLLAVDPADENLVYLRLQGSGQRDQFALYRHPGGLVHPAFTLGGLMTAFLHRSDGALLLANADGATFISNDGGGTFRPWLQGLHLRALAERDGVVYAAGDDTRDGFALAALDNGETPRPLLRFSQIDGPLTCGDLARLCSDPFATLQATLANPPPPEASPLPNPNQKAQGAALPHAETNSQCALRDFGARSPLPALLVLGAWLTTRRVVRKQRQRKQSA